MAKKICKRYICHFTNQAYYNDKKRFKEKLKEIVKNYFEGVYQEDLSVFTTVHEAFGSSNLSSYEQSRLQKFLLIFFLGQILDLPNLHSILVELGISSNRTSKIYSEIQKKASLKDILKLYERVLEHQLSEYLSRMCSKHSCIFSRELVTVVLDDSVFKQWLSSFKLGEDFEACYGKFFSTIVIGRSD